MWLLPRLTLGYSNTCLEGWLAVELRGRRAQRDMPTPLLLLPAMPIPMEFGLTRKAIGRLPAKQATASPVTVVSEAGQEFVLAHPWGNRSVEARSNGTAVHVAVEGGRLRFPTEAGRTYEIATSQ